MVSSKNTSGHHGILPNYRPGGVTARLSECAQAGASVAGIALALPPPQMPAPAEPDIRVEVQRDNASIVVKWPLQGGAACAAWLREWLR